MRDELPDLLADVVELLGEGPMLRLAHEFGGTQIYVPQAARIGPEHPLARSLGLANAQRFAGAFGPGHLTVPLGPTAAGERCRRAAIQALSEGKSNRIAARRAGMTTRGVEMIRARIKRKRGDGGPQGDLFGKG